MPVKIQHRQRLHLSEIRLRIHPLRRTRLQMLVKDDRTYPLEEKEIRMVDRIRWVLREKRQNRQNGQMPPISLQVRIQQEVQKRGSESL